MYVVIFRSTRTNHDDELYMTTAARMVEAVKQTPGYISHSSHFDAKSRTGVTFGYFETEDNIKQWRENFEHVEARELGREKFYESYSLVVAKVERQYSWESSDIK